MNGAKHTRGKGVQKRGQMCVEAAVCAAMGLPHSDDPPCVSRALRSVKIRLNDSNWSSNEARAKGLRRLAVAQLGSMGVLDDKEFTRRVVDLAIRKSVPEALRAAAGICKDVHKSAAMRDAADRCEKEGTREAALAGKDAAAAAYAAAYAAYAAAAYAATYDAYAAAGAAAADAAAAYARAEARDTSLASFCEGVVQILIDMKAPGCQWLPLTEPAITSTSRNQQATGPTSAHATVRQKPRLMC